MKRQQPIQQWMILITYRIRQGAEADGYDEWLRTVDNPFFNRFKAIAHYTNWKVAASTSPVPFTHVDFLVIDNVEDLEMLWFNPDLDTFRKKWVEMWGITPPDRINSNCHLCVEEEGGIGLPKNNHVLLLPAPANPVPDGASLWSVRELVRKHYVLGPNDSWRTDALDEAFYKDFYLQYSDKPISIVELGQYALQGSASALSCELIASPD